MNSGLNEKNTLKISKYPSIENEADKLWHITKVKPQVDTYMINSHILDVNKKKSAFDMFSINSKNLDVNA